VFIIYEFKIYCILKRRRIQNLPPIRLNLQANSNPVDESRHDNDQEGKASGLHQSDQPGSQVHGEADVQKRDHRIPYIGNQITGQCSCTGRSEMPAHFFVFFKSTSQKRAANAK
jgi:hypothetical protein